MTLAYKQKAAAAALEEIPPDCRLGVGAGSTVNCLIDLLPGVAGRLRRIVAASEETARRLERAGLHCCGLDAAGGLDLCIDGADEADDNRQLIKGGGGAHTREKILAHAARRFVAIVDEGKMAKRLGGFPLPVEVVPMARGHVARQLAGMGANVAWREGFVTDNGNWILDARDLDLTNAAQMERDINAIAGVVENGIFAIRRPCLVLAAGAAGVRRIAKSGGAAGGGA